jgi:hypothetical protein
VDKEAELAAARTKNASEQREVAKKIEKLRKVGVCE